MTPIADSYEQRRKARISRRPTRTYADKNFLARVPPRRDTRIARMEIIPLKSLGELLKYRNKQAYS